MNLEEEIIDGYLVSAKMKRIWAKEIRLLRQFVDVCERHKLKYRIMGGTLLGAVRHKGYIPWDNDIDVAMFRDDFNKLLEIGEKEFQKPSFFQTSVSEEGRLFSTYIKIRDCESTAGCIEEYKKGINCGIFIDVFCLDELPNGKLTRKCFVKRLSSIAKMQRFCINQPSKQGLMNTLKYKVRKVMYQMDGSPNAVELFEKYQKQAGKYWGKGGKQVSHLAFGYHDNFVWDYEDWKEGVELEFGDDMFISPKGYDAVLKKQYGNYLRIPDDKSTHDYFVFDPDVPFTEYFRMIPHLSE